MADSTDKRSHFASQVQQGFVDNWQGGKSIAECNLHMLNCEDTCDVSFRVGDEGQVVKAHRYVLISRSCVFYSMFTGPLAETSDVRIPDVKAKDFKTFLTYLYTDETIVDADNVTALLYMAQKYAVTGLETQCRKFSTDNISTENACGILETGYHFDEDELKEQTLGLICEEDSKALESPCVPELSRDQVGKISELAELKANKEVLSEAVVESSASECKRNSLEIRQEKKQAVLGDFLKNIRFGFIRPTFRSRRAKSDSERENSLDSIKYEKLNSKPRRTLKKAYKPRTITRFASYGTKAGLHCSEINALRFMCNKRVILHGIKLYGPLNWTETYTVTSYLGTEETVMSTEIQAAACDTYEVLFPSPPELEADSWYTVAVVIKGPHSHIGNEGRPCIVDRDGVEFRFENSKHNPERTNVSIGQIPSLIYTNLET